MKGGIVEREPVKPKPLGSKPVPIATALTLPPSVRTTKPNIPEVVDVKKYKTEPQDISNIDHSQHEFSANDELIRNMTPEQLQEALAEITSLLSKESIDFLLGKKPQKSSEDSNTETGLDSNNPDSDDEPPELEPKSESISSMPIAKATVDGNNYNTLNKLVQPSHGEIFNLDGKRVLQREEAYTLVANSMVKQHPFLGAIDSDHLLSITQIIISYFEDEHFVLSDVIEEGSMFSLSRAIEVYYINILCI